MSQIWLNVKKKAIKKKEACYVLVTSRNPLSNMANQNFFSSKYRDFHAFFFHKSPSYLVALDFFWGRYGAKCCPPKNH
jgi:hypothetical protein